VALPAFACGCCGAATADHRPAGRAAIGPYLLPAVPTTANPPQRHAAAGWDRQTDGPTPVSCIGLDPAARRPIMRAMPKMRCLLYACLCFCRHRFLYQMVTVLPQTRSGDSTQSHTVQLCIYEILENDGPNHFSKFKCLSTESNF